jgi:hypothetical protein
VNVAIALPADFSEPISPELVLVSPPEVARAARSLLAAGPTPRVAVTEREFGAIELTAVWCFSVAATLGPLLLYLLASRTS